MHETAEEVAGLQALIDRSFVTAGPHLVSISTPDHRLSAEDVVAYLVGMKHLALATVTAAGEPRVSPVDGLFLHGAFWFSTSGEAVRARHLEVRPQVSATHFVGDDLAVTVHGTAYVIRGATPEAAAVRPHWEAVYDGSGPEDWTDTPEQARYIRIDADRMFTYCSDRAKLAALLPSPQPHS